MEEAINLKTFTIQNINTFEESVKYLKTKYRSNKERFISRFLESFDVYLQMNDIEEHVDITDVYHKLWDEVDVFSYEEAFSIKDNNSFMAMVFSVIDIPNMIKELGSKRIKVEGIDLKNKIFKNGKFKDIELNQVYELHEIKGDKLGLRECIYAIKCWCTSTNNEHWLWTTPEKGKSKKPLDSIASTCMYYKPMEGHIKHIIRQGDVFLFEMKDTYDPNTLLLKEDIVSFTDKNAYFSLLKSQS